MDKKQVMNYLFTSESVSEGHPDKIADQISDALLDSYLAFDENSKVACETLVTSGQVVLAGEVKSNSYVDVAQVARDVIADIGYTKSEYRFDAKSCGVLSAIHEQSSDINQGVDGKEDEMDQGAGDQGMMFGYASTEGDNYMPLTLDISHAILEELALIRKEELHLMPYLRPDSKSQVTMEYQGDGTPLRIHTIVVATQHDEFVKLEDRKESDKQMQNRIKEDVRKILIPRVRDRFKDNAKVYGLFSDDYRLLVNPTGRFVIGGPHGDTGLTGRKIIVDTYGGRAPHGGGAFSGKDPSKVDRSAAYASRHIAKNLVAAGVADEVKIQVSYAIGVAEPMNIFVDTYGRSNVELSDAEIGKKVEELFDMRPRAIEKRLKLRQPMYLETATYGHYGRMPKVVKKRFESKFAAEAKEIDVELFTWEKLDYVEQIKEAFGL